MKNNNKKLQNVKIAKSAKIEKGVKFIGQCTIGENTFIGFGSVVENSSIGNNCKIMSSYIEGGQISDNVTIGPFAHIRPETIVDDGVKIGNFVEIKNSYIGKNTKIPHHAYVGDAKIGVNCNIGCGVIFANYNGKIKQQIEVGDNCFIGSNSNLIAPLKIANNSYICAGTTLTQNTNPDDFVIARCKETIKPGKAKDYITPR